MSPAAFFGLVAGQPLGTLALLVAAIAGWCFLAWLTIAMDHPFAMLTMPGSPSWPLESIAAIWAMWAVMMAAMMLPSALPMVLTFVHLSTVGGRARHGHVFVAAYLVVWFAFSVVATALQWALQAAGWVDMMVVATSPFVAALLLLIAGIYQFSPLKRICLGKCRTPIGFLLGEWRGGMRGAFAMGLRHGLFCMGCCWALMVLLFVGGAMNLAWVAALALVVAIEKLAPHGEMLAGFLGAALVGAGLFRLFALVF